MAEHARRPPFWRRLRAQMASPTTDRKRLLLMAAMWAGALGASWALYASQREDDVPVIATSRATPTHLPAKAQPPLLATTAHHYRVDRRHRGQSMYRGPSQATARWTYDLQARVTAQPVLDDHGKVVIGTHAGVLWALNHEGIVQWKRELGARIFAAALLDNVGNIYVGTDGRGFYGLDAKGQTRFQIATEGDADTAPTLAADGTLRFAAGRKLYAIDQSGRVLWTFDAGDKIFSAPTLDDEGNTYFGAQDDHIYSIDAHGKQRFAYKTSDDVDVSPVLDSDGTLYVGSDDQHVYALSAAGQLRWATKLDGHVRGALALGSNGTLIATHGGPRGALVALDRATGAQRFRFAFGLTDSTDTGVRGGAMVDADGAIYAGSDDDYLYALTPEGKLRWALAVGSDQEAATVIANDGTLYAVSAKGVLRAIGGEP